MSAHRGSYDPNSPVTPYNTIRPLSIKSVDGRSPQYSQRADSVSGPLGIDRDSTDARCCSFLRKVENFKDSLAEIGCCEWLHNVPPVPFLAGVVILLAALIALPFVVALLIMRGFSTNLMAESETLAMVRTQSKWPTVDPSLQLNSFKSLIPPNVTLCRGYGFSCTNLPSLVIGTLQRCDGIEDCPDGSDEIGCKLCQTTVNCSSSTHGVKSWKHSVCLRGSSLCDGNIDCPDGVDEKRYCKKECSKYEVRCGDTGLCLTRDQICDGDVQCKYGEDEKGCDGICRGGAIWCVETEKCIPKWQICDGIRNCPNGRDEMECTCKECSGTGKALCNNTNVCIKRSQVCDGNEDCPGGDDEVNCPGSCASSSKKDDDFIRCRDGARYHKKFACSGMLKACQGRCSECDEETAFTCKNGKCIRRSLVCDGLDDCGDKSDEANCDCTDMKQREDAMQCKVYARGGMPKCIPLTRRCDGYEDCPDGEDEKDCEKCKNPNAIFCEPSKNCLSSAKRCDGITDCPNGKDERRCTCAECEMHGYPMYMCANVARCFRRDDVCNPYTRCPNASKLDKLFCASQARQGASMVAKKNV